MGEGINPTPTVSKCEESFNKIQFNCFFEKDGAGKTKPCDEYVEFEQCLKKQNWKPRSSFNLSDSVAKYLTLKRDITNELIRYDEKGKEIYPEPIVAVYLHDAVSTILYLSIEKSLDLIVKLAADLGNVIKGGKFKTITDPLMDKDESITTLLPDEQLVNKWSGIEEVFIVLSLTYSVAEAKKHFATQKIKK